MHARKETVMLLDSSNILIQNVRGIRTRSFKKDNNFPIKSKANRVTKQ